MHDPVSHPRPKQYALTLQDRSRYFLGLLLLTTRDGVLHPEEKRRMRDVAHLLDFEASFCEKAMDNVLLNPYLLDKPIKFSSAMVAKAFLHDALCLALADGELATSEWEWLESVALINGIPLTWLSAQRETPKQDSHTQGWAAQTWWSNPEYATTP